MYCIQTLDYAKKNMYCILNISRDWNIEIEFRVVKHKIFVDIVSNVPGFHLREGARGHSPGDLLKYYLYLDAFIPPEIL